jgi:hypothetical protein
LTAIGSRQKAAADAGDAVDAARRSVGLLGDVAAHESAVSPVADEYKTVWVPILSPLYRTENRRSPAAVDKTMPVAA